MVSTWYKYSIQFMYHVDSWKDVKKTLTIIVQCVNEVKCYFNFHINNLKLSKRRSEFLCKCKVQFMNNIIHLLSNLDSTYARC